MLPYLLSCMIEIHTELLVFIQISRVGILNYWIKLISKYLKKNL